MEQTTVVVVGGGATGIGILRDLSMRGVKAVLLEQGGLAHGTSARFHGLLHSGARYAVKDELAASECIDENRILHRIARHCVEESGGYFCLCPEDDPAYVEKWVLACRKAGIFIEEIDIEDALQEEPNLSPNIQRVFRVPDAGIDGFRLVWHNALASERLGAIVMTGNKLTHIEVQSGAVVGVTATNTATGEETRIACEYVISAAGSWAGEVAHLAGLDVNVSPDLGALVTFNHRFCSRVINRLHASGNGDIFVPHGSVTILGTTSAATNQLEKPVTTVQEVKDLLELGKPLFPQLNQYRILRAFSGTRPLYTPPGTVAGREASRNFVIVDHAQDGLKGLVSIFGGKLTTYRLMAEKVTDLVCKNLGIKEKCRTAIEPIFPEPNEALLDKAKKYFPAHSIPLVLSRSGPLFEDVINQAAKQTKNDVLCECELVTQAEITEVAKTKGIRHLGDIRTRTRLGMGTCQGTFCSLRATANIFNNALNRLTDNNTADNNTANNNSTGAPFNESPQFVLASFLQERWKGIRPALWDTQVKEAELNRAISMATFNLDNSSEATAATDKNHGLAQSKSSS